MIVDDGQFFDAVLLQNAFGFFEGAGLRGP